MENLQNLASSSFQFQGKPVVNPVFNMISMMKSVNVVGPVMTVFIQNVCRDFRMFKM